MKRIVVSVLLLTAALSMAGTSWAAAKTKAASAAAPTEAPAEAEEPAPEETTDFLDVVRGGGPFGIALWIGLAGLSLASAALAVDSFVNVREKKIMPPALVSLVREAVEEGNPKKAAQRCRDVPGPYANILLAGFENANDGFDAVQDAVAVAAEMESERILQRVNYLNVVGNLSPMLGLLGTVQGMILAFATLSVSSGAAKNALLAMNISQALYTTAAGLLVAVPSIGFYFVFRNRAAKLMLAMESRTLELMKAFRRRDGAEERGRPRSGNERRRGRKQRSNDSGRRRNDRSEGRRP